MKKWIFVFLVAVPAAAQEVTMTLTWAQPTEYEDGSLIGPGELTTYELGCGPVPGDRSIHMRMWMAEDGVTLRSEPVAMGNYYCALRVNATIAGFDPGPPSEWSGEYFFPALPRPRAPTGLTIVAGAVS